jgi:hypothetical protein
MNPTGSLNRRRLIAKSALDINHLNLFEETPHADRMGGVVGTGKDNLPVTRLGCRDRHFRLTSLKI